MGANNLKCDRDEDGDHRRRGDCTLPVVRDKITLPDGTVHRRILSHECRAPQGGDKTVKPPVYQLTVKNPPDGETFLPGS